MTTPDTYAGESEADKANLSIRRALTDRGTRKSITDDEWLHGLPLGCMEYRLGKLDAVSKALVASALNTLGRIATRHPPPSALAAETTVDSPKNLDQLQLLLNRMRASEPGPDRDQARSKNSGGGDGPGHPRRRMTQRTDAPARYGSRR